jgi:lysophospholipase L1-like esterase
MKIRTQLLCATLSVGACLGQSLSVGRNNSGLWLHASAPANDPFTIQASSNLHLWVDIQNDVPEQYSLALTNTDAPARFYRLTPTTPEAAPIRVMIIGDSLAADCCGWGQGLNGFFKPNAGIINYAESWNCTRIFLASPQFEQMRLVKPDYVLIQWGYLDGSTNPERSTTPEQFAENLRTIVEAVRQFNGVPILMTVPAERMWDATGKLVSSDRAYNVITKHVATELKTPMIDLYQLSFELFSKLGEDGCEFMLWPRIQPWDGIHLSPLGAVYVAQVIAQALPDSLGPYLVGIFDPPPKP